jgi:hypothetical protein
MNTFRPKAMMRGQFDLNRDNLSHPGEWGIAIFAHPRDHKPVPAHILGMHGASQPDARRRHVASQLDFDPRILAPVDGFHLLIFDIAKVTLQTTRYNMVNGLYLLVFEGY